MKRLPAILFFLLVVSLLLPASPTARAQDDPISIEVSPTQVTMVMAAGDETVEVVQLRNRSERVTHVTTLVEPGAEAQDLEVEVEPAEIKMAPGESAEAQIRVRAPAAADAGSRRFAVLFRAEPGTGGEVSVTGQVKVELEAQVIQPVAEAELAAPYLVDWGSSLRFMLSGRNRASYPLRFHGRVKFNGLFREQSFAADSETIGVGERGGVVIDWENPPAFAVGRVTMSLETGTGVPLEERHLLIIFPWRYTLLSLCLAAAAAAGFFAVRSLA